MDAKIDLTDIAHFVRVAERESFSDAARTLGVPTSTVSRSVARLEDALGVRLLERTTRKVKPTSSGRALLEEAAAPLKRLSEATSRIADLHDKPCGPLRVTMPSDMAVMAGPLLAEFLERYPSVSIELLLTNRYVDLVEEGVDVALRAGKLADSSLIARKLKETEAHLFASPKYLQSAPPLRTPKDLAEHRAVLFKSRENGATWSLVHAGTGKKVSVEMKGRLDGDNLSFIRSAAVAGEGIALLPEGPTREEVESGALVRVLAPWGMPVAPLNFVVPSGRHLAPRVQVFREFLVERFAGEKWWGEG